MVPPGAGNPNVNQNVVPPGGGNPLSAINCTAMSSVIDNDDTNKQCAVATVVLYNKNKFKLMK